MDLSINEKLKDKYDGYLLMKFFSKREYLEEFMDGILFFNTSDYFRECENEGQQDSDEGMGLIYTQKDSNDESPMYIAKADKNRVINEESKIQVYSYSPSKYRRQKIICFHAAYANLLNNKIYLPTKKMAEEFGSYVAVIPKRQILFDAVVKKIKEDDKVEEAKIGFVDYIEKQSMQGVSTWNAYKKREKYSYQNELRISFINDNRDVKKIDIGKEPMKNVYSMKSDELARRITLRNGILII